jgi:hypothetical protein
MIPNKPQKMLMVNPLANLKPITNSIGAVIASGLGRVTRKSHYQYSSTGDRHHDDLL